MMNSAVRRVNAGISIFFTIGCADMKINFPTIVLQPNKRILNRIWQARQTNQPRFDILPLHVHHRASDLQHTSQIILNFRLQVIESAAQGAGHHFKGVLFFDGKIIAASFTTEYEVVYALIITQDL